MNVSKKDLFFGYLSQGLNVGVGLLLLPIALNKLSSANLGLWLIFMNIVSIIPLLDFGFSPTVSRNVTYVLSGAQKLEKVGVSHRHEQKRCDVNYSLFFLLIKAIRKIYQRIGYISLLLLGIAGSVYIASIVSKSNITDTSYIYLSWVIYAIAITLNMYYLCFNAILLGQGKITQNYLVNIISRLVMIALSIVGLLLGYGLISLAIAYAISVFVGRIICYKFINDSLYVKLKTEHKTKNKPPECKKIIHVLWYNSSRTGWVCLGAFLINKFSLLVAGFYLPLSESASYIMTFQILGVVMSVSQIYFQTHVPFFNQLQLHKKHNELKKKYIHSLCVTLFLMIAGCFAFVLTGPWILANVIHTKTTLVDTGMLLAISSMLFLELNHSVAAGFITTTNKIPFVKAALISGFGIVVLSLISVGYLKTGLWGLIFSQGLVQLLYNNWKWPVVVWKMLKSM